VLDRDQEPLSALERAERVQSWSTVKSMYRELALVSSIEVVSSEVFVFQARAGSAFGLRVGRGVGVS
jgi:hypothetical protein